MTPLVRADIQAIALISVIVVTALICVGFRADRYKLYQRRDRLWSLLYCVPLMVMMSFRNSDFSTPLNQWGVPLVCLIVTLAVTRDGKARRLWSRVLVVAGIGLTIHWLILDSNSDVFVTDLAELRQTRQSPLIEARDALQELAKSDRSFRIPVGWLHERNLVLPPGYASEHGTIEQVFRPREVVAAEPQWHTRLTGLYARRSIEMGMWCYIEADSANPPVIDWRPLSGGSEQPY
ncbi:MAG TPA: hypothetical protein VG797_11780 [Phycisphaerales bacterium]|nr:hypothetical protein [Phycisphaerales bacterium]